MQHQDAAEAECTPNNPAAPAGIPFAFDDYCELIDWTGRAIRDDKRGHIPVHIQPLLQQLGIKPDHWLDTVKHFGSRFPRMMGRVDRLKQALDQFNSSFPAQEPPRNWCRPQFPGKHCPANDRVCAQRPYRAP